jgi:predicted  nucleic acid-binding Zn-ribbon protein
MHADLERLIQLQHLDSAGEDARRRLAEEPGRQKAFEARLDTIRLDVGAGKDQLAASQATRRELEKEVAVHQARLSRFREQAMAVKTNQEYHAIQHEITFAQSEIKNLEDRILERMLEADELGTATKRAESALLSEQKAVDGDRQTLAAELADLTITLERIGADRAEIVARIDPKVLAIFEMVASRRGGIGVAEARHGICTICHVRLRPQVFNTILRNDEIIQCDTCQRVLYFSPQAPAAEGAPQPAQ